MLAIPSPDLLINLFASAGQALGLFAVLLGGAWFARRNTPVAVGIRPQQSRWPFRIVLGLFLVTGTTLLFFYLHTVDEKNQRLRRNVVRIPDFSLRPVQDPDFKPMPVREQVRHPRAIDTSVVDQWRKEGKKLNLIDVRETPETLLGMLPGGWHIRFPEIMATGYGIEKQGEKTILYCARGNRSAEICSEFFKRGHDCWFMIGGTEKWLAENREFVGLGSKDRKDIRDIPDFPNKHVLLETKDVMRMVQKEGAIFVDGRYPEDFKADHLPGAINLTYRKLLNDELDKALYSVPKKPIITPCYDERSAFFAMVLGWALQQRGYDFRGRYTLPHEYYVPRPPQPYTQKWLDEKQRHTLAGMVQGSMSGGLAALRDRAGSLVAAILVLVLCLRLLVLPFGLKAERDQLYLRSLLPRVRDLQRSFACDPGRLRRAMVSLYRAERLSPVRNLVGVLVQIILFILAFLAVNAAATDAKEGFLWLKSLGEADSSRALPLLVGVLALALLASNSARRTALRWILWAAASAGLAWIVWDLKAAANLYLVVNMVLVLVQGFAVRAWRRLSQRRPSHRHAKPDPAERVISLEVACCVPAAGNKAARLARMWREGLPVPDGFVVIPHDGDLDVEVDSAWRRLAATKVAVRSSGLHEDGPDRSYAGEFVTILNVERGDLHEVIERVRTSVGGNERGSGSVLVQRMVDSQYSGVLFTEDPSCTGSMLVEWIPGLCDELVGGRVTPQALRYARSNHDLLSGGTPPIDLAALLELGMRAESLFGRPQDIEWAYADGRFHVLQARDITTSRKGRGVEAVRERERHRLLEMARGAAPDQVVFAQTELLELLPRPTPFSLAFMDSLWASGGSTDIACRALGVPYDVQEDSRPFVVEVFGRLYVNRLEERRRLARPLGTISSFQLARRGEDIERAFREGFLPSFSRSVRLREAVDLTKLSEDELLETYREDRDRFVTRTYVQAEVINVAADVYLKTAAAKLRRRGLDPAVHLTERPDTIISSAFSDLERDGDAGIFEFMRTFGHRAHHDFELSEPRYAEDPASVKAMVQRTRSDGSNGSGPSHGTEAASRDTAGRLGRLLSFAVERARRFEALKEEAKHHCLRGLACLRSVVVEIGRRFGLARDVFFLTPDEVERLSEPEFRSDARTIVDERRRAGALFHDADLPAELTLRDLEVLGVPGLMSSVFEGPRPPDISRGTKVAGDHEAIGPARVMRTPEDLGHFREGEVLVARFTDPSWLPVFQRARGIVTEVGGWLSHAAIQARERNITAIVGVKDALHAFATGDLLELRADGTVHKLAERRMSPRRTVRIAASVVENESRVPVTICDLSSNGAAVTGLAVETGRQVVLEIGGTRKRVTATVVRTEGSLHGLAFSGSFDQLSIQGVDAVA